MNRRDKITGVLAGAFLFLGLVFGGGCKRIVSLVYPDNQCVLSKRDIHPEIAVKVLLEGKRHAENGCCLRCAVTYADQTGTTVRVLSVTDYVTRNPIAPDRAFYVSGSGLAPCVSHLMAASEERHDVALSAWDRCAPSSIAFAKLEDAQAFQRSHGGRVQTFAQVIGSSKVVAQP